jgi:hypothetical protein
MTNLTRETDTADHWIERFAGHPRPVPDRALALDAIRLLPRLVDRRARPIRWSSPTFAREVEAIRSQLIYVRSRVALAAAYDREAAHLAAVATGTDTDVMDDPGALRIAYALRWLELGDGFVGPTWPAMMGPCG